MLTKGLAFTFMIVYLMALQLFALYHYVLHRRGQDRTLLQRIVFGESVPPYFLWIGVGALYTGLFLLLWPVPFYGLFYFTTLTFLTTALLMILICNRCENVLTLLKQYQYYIAGFLFYFVINIGLYTSEPKAASILYFARAYYIPVAYLIAGYLYFTLRVVSRKPDRHGERE